MVQVSNRYFTSLRYGRKSADRISTVRAFAFPSRRAGLRARTRLFSRCAPYRWYAAPRTLGGGGSHGNGPDKFPMELYPIVPHHSGQNLPTRFLVSSVIRTITITALFHPARHWRRRHARRLGSDSLSRSRRRNRGRELVARRIFENAIEIADLHRMLLHHGRHDSGELIDFPRSDTT